MRQYISRIWTSITRFIGDCPTFLPSSDKSLLLQGSHCFCNAALCHSFLSSVIGQSGDIAIDILFLTMYQLSDMCHYKAKQSVFHFHCYVGPGSAVQHAAHAKLYHGNSVQSWERHVSLQCLSLVSTLLSRLRMHHGSGQQMNDRVLCAWQTKCPEVVGEPGCLSYASHSPSKISWAKE